MAWGGPGRRADGRRQRRSGQSAAAGLPFAGVPAELADRVEAILDAEPEHPEPEVHFAQRGDRASPPSPCATSSAPHRLGLLGAFGLVVLETITLQAGPLLTQIGIDQGIVREGHRRPGHRHRRSTWLAIVRQRPGRHRPHPLHRPPRRAPHVRAAPAGVLPPPAPVARLLHRREGGPADDPDDQRHRVAQPALPGRPGQPGRPGPDPGRGHGRPVHAQRRAGPDHPGRGRAGDAGADAVVPVGLRPRLHDGAGPHRRRAGRPAGEPLGHPGPRGPQPAPPQRRQPRQHRRRVPRRQPLHRPGGRHLRPGHRDRRRAGPGDDPGHRRGHRARRPADRRRADRLRPLRHRLLRPHPAAGPALQHLPAGPGRGDQAAGPARHRARRSSRPPTPSTSRRWRAPSSSGTCTSPTSPASPCSTASTCASNRARRSPSWARPARASRPSPSWSPASTTSTRGPVLLDGHDVRDVTIASLRRQIGVVPQEPFLFNGSIRDNIAFARPDASDDEVLGDLPDRGHRRPRRAPARRASTRRCTSGACRCRPASASCWPWPGPSSPDPGSWCSTRPPRTWT